MLQRYRWKTKIEGKLNPLLTPHPVYLALHANPAGRRRAYRNLFRDALSDEWLVQMRCSTNACGVIGSGAFREQIAALLGRAVSAGKRGRPPKPPAKRGLTPLTVLEKRFDPMG
jgi:putative transposase